MKEWADVLVVSTTTLPVLWWMANPSAWVSGIPLDKRIMIDCDHYLTRRLTSFWFVSPLSAPRRSTTWRPRYGSTPQNPLLFHTKHELKPHSGTPKLNIMRPMSLSSSSAPNSTCVKIRPQLKTSELRRWSLSHTSRLLVLLKKSRPRSILSALPWRSATWRAFSTKLFGNISRSYSRSPRKLTAYLVPFSTHVHSPSPARRSAAFCKLDFVYTLEVKGPRSHRTVIVSLDYPVFGRPTLDIPSISFLAPRISRHLSSHYPWIDVLPVSYSIDTIHPGPTPRNDKITLASLLFLRYFRF